MASRFAREALAWASAAGLLCRRFKSEVQQGSIDGMAE